MSGPLFVCHANCSRSVLACYLYRHLCNNASARSAGLEPGERISERVETLLGEWGIDASGHRPLKVSRDLCMKADAIFVMAPSYLHRLLWEYGEDHANKAYLFADPFSWPLCFRNGEYRVHDPSFDDRPPGEVLPGLAWMRERVLQIRWPCSGRAGSSSRRASTWSCARPWIDEVIDDSGVTRLGQGLLQCAALSPSI